jgi:hypothetical protein
MNDVEIVTSVLEQQGFEITRRDLVQACRQQGESKTGQLAERCYHASGDGCAHADHALRIQVSMVWSSCSKLEHFGSRAAGFYCHSAGDERYSIGARSGLARPAPRPTRADGNPDRMLEKLSRPEARWTEQAEVEPVARFDSTRSGAE